MPGYYIFAQICFWSRHTLSCFMKCYSVANKVMINMPVYYLLIIVNTNTSNIVTRSSYLQFFNQRNYAKTSCVEISSILKNDMNTMKP